MKHTYNLARDARDTSTANAQYHTWNNAHHKFTENEESNLGDDVAIGATSCNGRQIK